MKERKKLNDFRGGHDVLRNLTNTRVRRLYQTIFIKCMQSLHSARGTVNWISLKGVQEVVCKAV